jgi:ribonuclease P protein subunit RPR2
VIDKTTKQIARQRVVTLLRLAEAECKDNPELARRYVAVARRIAMAARIRLPVEYRRRVCRKCNALLVYGVNCRVRVQPRRESHVVVTCLSCGRVARIPVRRRVKV